MSAAKFTPGPWETRREEGDEVGRYVFPKSFLDKVVTWDQNAWDSAVAYVGLSHTQREANARLIAATPDLYAAAVAARAALSELLTTRDPVVFADALRMLDQAIDKAEGRS